MKSKIVCLSKNDEFKEIFIKNGGENWQLVESLNDNPKWIEALEELATS